MARFSNAYAVELRRPGGHPTTIRPGTLSSRATRAAISLGESTEHLHTPNAESVQRTSTSH